MVKNQGSDLRKERDPTHTHVGQLSQKMNLKRREYPFRFWECVHWFKQIRAFSLMNYFAFTFSRTSKYGGQEFAKKQGLVDNLLRLLVGFSNILQNNCGIRAKSSLYGVAVLEDVA